MPEDLFAALAAAAGTTRMWAHTTELLAIDAWILLLHATLYRFALVPRALSAFGLATVTLHATGIPLRGLLGYRPDALMGAPMGLSHVALALWLAIKGFDERHPSSTGVEATAAERAAVEVHARPQKLHSRSPPPDFGGPMKRVTGIGGIFFKANDAPSLLAWYEKHLGIEVQEWGGTAFNWTDGEGKPFAGTTVWSIGSAQGDQFAPSTATFMVNYRVDDLHALVEVLREEGCNVLERIDESEYGTFAWVIDPEGNKVELWQPPAGQ